MVGLLGDKKEGLLFIISAPAGTGKTTLVKKLVEEFPSIATSISYTTRSPRNGEIQGIDYHFINQTDFEKKIAQSDFIEYVKLYEYYYGTSGKWVKEQQKRGKHVVLVIDTQGALKLKRLLSAVYIFIRPPSLTALQERLVKRQTESVQMIEQRLKWAEEELKVAEEYDYEVINDDLKTAYEVIKSIFIAECHRLDKKTFNEN